MKCLICRKNKVELLEDNVPLYELIITDTSTTQSIVVYLCFECLAMRGVKKVILKNIVLK